MRKTLLSLTLAALVAAALAATPALGGTFTRSAVPCSSQVFEQPFTRWLDYGQYTLAPSGTFESGVGDWSVSGGAKVVTGNESFFVHKAGESRSLSLPAGSSATSRPMCAKLLYPELRLFAVNRGSLLSTLKVEVLTESLDGKIVSLPLTPLAGTATWQPTLPIPFVVNAAAPLIGNDGSIAVAFRFTPLGSGGAWAIDDVYLDPYKAR